MHLLRAIALEPSFDFLDLILLFYYIMQSNTTRNLAADKFQLIATNIISIISVSINVIGYFLILTSKCRFKFQHFLYLSTLFISQLHFGTVMNVVFLLPVPGLYCIGWVKNEQDHMDIYITITYKLFLFQYEILVLILFLKLCKIARPDSIFNLPLPIIFGITLAVFSFNILPTFIMLKLFNPTRDESETAILLHYPHYSFAARYSFLWVMIDDIMIIAFACILFMSLGLILFAICTLYVLIYYELQRQEMYMAKEVYKQNKEFINGVMYHTRIISIVYCVFPLSIFCQFLIKEETDVSVPVSIAYVIFVSSPIPAMLSFLWRNPACWSRRIRNSVNLAFEN